MTTRKTINDARRLIREAREGKFQIPSSLTGGDLTAKFATLYSQTARESKLLRPKNLINEFVDDRKLNRLVLELYSGKSYALLFKEGNGVEHKIDHCDEEYDEILNYIDNEQLIPGLISDLSKVLNLLYDLCVIVEIRDFRNGNSCCEPRYSLLRPNSQTVMEITRLYYANNPDLPPEIANRLESILATCISPPICLNPDPVVSVVDNLVEYTDNIFTNHSWESVKKRKRFYSGESVAFKKYRKEVKIASLELLQCIHEKMSEPINEYEEIDLPESVKANIDAAPPVEEKLLNIKAISKIIDNVPKYVSLVNYNSKPETFECGDTKLYSRKILQNQYIMELLTEEFPVEDKVFQSARIEVTRLPVEEQYYGKLAVKYLGDTERSSSEILLGPKPKVDEFVNKFVEVFTEEETKIVRKLHEAPGKYTAVTYTEKGLMTIKKALHDC